MELSSLFMDNTSILVFVIPANVLSSSDSEIGKYADVNDFSISKSLNTEVSSITVFTNSCYSILCKQ